MGGSFHDLREDPAHVLGVDEEDQRPMGADARLTEHAGALGLELGLGGVDVGHLEADMVLPAERIALEELHDRRVLAQRLDQLDLRIGRVDEADADALRGEVEGGAMRLGAEHGPIGVEALLDRRRRDANMVEAAEFHWSIVTSVVTLLAMKQASWARWWRPSISSGVGGLAPEKATFGRSITFVIAILPSSRLSRRPSASST